MQGGFALFASLLLFHEESLNDRINIRDKEASNRRKVQHGVQEQD
jgi:hypothetical protein